MSHSRKNLTAEERRKVTIDTVVDLAANQNPNNITTATIAKHMNLTQGALFRHFSNKEAIWEAVMEWVSKRLLSKLNKAANNSTNPLDALHDVFMTHINFIVAHPGVPRMLFGELQRAENTPAKNLARLALKKYGVLIVSLIERGKTQNLVAGDINPNTASLMFIGCIQGLVMQSMLNDDINLMKDKASDIYKLFRISIEKKL